MFLIRVTFWVVILLLLLPTNVDTQYSIYNITSATFKDLRGFCERNPQTCEQSKYALTHLKEKAVFAGRMFMNMMGKNDQDTAALENRDLDELENRTMIQKSDMTQQSENKGPPIEVIEVKPYQRPVAQVQNGHNKQNHLKAQSREHTLKEDDLKSEWSGPIERKGS